MHATFVTLWLQVVQPLANAHETKWTPHVKRETDVAQSYNALVSPSRRRNRPFPRSMRSQGNVQVAGHVKRVDQGDAFRA